MDRNGLVITVAVATCGTALGVLVNNVPVIPRFAHRSAWLVGAVIAATLLSGALTWYVGREDDAQVRLVAPSAGQQVARPAQVDIRVAGSMPDGHTYWVAYRNAAGGNYFFQDSACTPTGDGQLTCTQLHLGHDEHDASTFTVYLLDADPQGTEALTKYSGQRAADSSQTGLAQLPHGVQIIQAVPGVTLQRPRSAPLP